MVGSSLSKQGYHLKKWMYYEKDSLLYSIADQVRRSGFIPSLVTTNESGHQPLIEQSECAEPWHWGKTFEEAKAICNKANQEKFGISPDEAFEIEMSCMFYPAELIINPAKELVKTVLGKDI